MSACTRSEMLRQDKEREEQKLLPKEFFVEANPHSDVVCVYMLNPPNKDGWRAPELVATFNAYERFGALRDHFIDAAERLKGVLEECEKWRQKQMQEK